MIDSLVHPLAAMGGRSEIGWFERQPALDPYRRY